ncbi:hypothetical protein IGI04_002562 [Brassica rapa subsp. trilocularis]|uniref:MAGE domain-containing protein n=1 Tax=Brassica rapa subsp. trilocularis TaxID=1813537 RepID=A0ABQ7NVX3_BRACM|nr:hypothetical protein IGI04_002562 [Brassica rapa subsp. trilocularis]
MLILMKFCHTQHQVANYKSSSPIDPPSTTLCRHFQERKMRLMASHLSLQILHQTMQTLPGKKELESKNQYKVKALNIVLAHGSMSLSGTKSPVAWQITLRSAEKKKESGASEDVSDEDLCILILGSLLHFDKVEVEFIKKGSSTTEELEAFVSALQVAGTKRGQDKASGGRGSVREATTDKTISQLESMGVIIYGVNKPLGEDSIDEISWDIIAGYDQQKR